MQDIDDNMDELFRKAAESYAPQKGESKWNDILPALSESAIAASTTKKNNSKKNIAFLLLLSLSIFSIILLFKIQGNKNETVQIQTNKASEKSEPANSNINIDNLNKKSTSFFGGAIKRKKQGYIKTENIIQQNQNTVVKDTKQGNSFPIVKNYSEPKNNFKHDKKKPDEKSPDIMNKTVTELVEKSDAKNTIDKNFVSLKNPQKLYVGFVTAPEFSQIKNQGIKKLGFDVGIIAGYKTGGNLSVETGLLLNKKNYFSDGKYFSMDKVAATMPSGMEVMNLKGSSTFLQIPIKVKYDVLHKKNATLFSSAGISSYVIMDEENDYLTLLNGAEQRMKGSYKTVANYFAATVDVSAGYEEKLGTSTNIRIEPYLQIPLKGTGMGSMPVTSAGVHIGIIKFIR